MKKAAYHQNDQDYFIRKVFRILQLSVAKRFKGLQNEKTMLNNSIFIADYASV